jgi:carbamoyl-phosphate synthase large subunit
MIRVGLTSIGGVTAAVFIKSLRLVEEEAFYIVGVDADKYAFGLKLVDKGYVIPLASEGEKYLRTLLGICKKERLDVLIPLMDEEMLTVVKARDRFEEIGTRVTLSPESAISISLDKLKTFEKLGSEVFANTIDASKYEDATKLNYPIVLKPRSGRGSRDTYICQDELDFRAFKRRVTDPIIQEYLQEPEYTVDVFSDLRARPLFAVPRRRIKVKAGVTWQGIVERQPVIEKLCMYAAEKIGITGPSCIQVRYDKNGRPKIFEVNPRIGGTTILSVFAGANIPYLTVKLFLDGTIVLPKKITEGMLISRFFDEVVYTPSDPER